MSYSIATPEIGYPGACPSGQRVQKHPEAEISFFVFLHGRVAYYIASGGLEPEGKPKTLEIDLPGSPRAHDVAKRTFAKCGLRPACIEFLANTHATVGM